MKTPCMSTENIFYVKHLFLNIFNLWYIKLVGAVAMSFVLYAIGEDKIQLAEALSCLIIIDFIMALISCYKTGEEIQSAKILRTAIKFTVYFLMVMSAHISEQATSLGFLDETMFAFLTLTELISVLEHASELGFSIPKAILNQIKSVRDNK